MSVNGKERGAEALVPLPGVGWAGESPGATSGVFLKHGRARVDEPRYGARAARSPAEAQLSGDPHQDDLDLGACFSAEARARLGIGAEDDLRLLARSGHAILLERGDGSGAAPPWDRDLVLCCDVRAFPLADLLSLVHSAGKSGYLLFEYESEQKVVYLSRGEVVFAESSLSTDRLGASLLRTGLLDQAQLELAERRYHPMTRFGKVVVELGMLTPRDLWSGVKNQVEEIVRSLFSYTGGWIHFWEGEVEPDNVVRLSLPTNRLIEEGLDRRDELLRFLASLEDPRCRIRPGEASRYGDASRAPASDNEKAVVDAVIGGCALFAEVCHRSGLDPRTTARTLQFLLLTGHVALDKDEGDDAPGFATADDDVVREAVSLHGRLILELSAPIIALDGPVQVADRLDRILAESAGRGRALLADLRFGEACGIDPGELEHRALRLPGDRLRQIDEALGEIVAYLEFELRNHPQIEDCTPFLEAVAPLRAMLAR